jgi:cyclic nucleotide-binding protein
VADAADLAGIPLFAALSDEERVALAPWFESATISPGVALVTEGAAGYSFYVLVDGAAVVTLDGEEVATYNPGDFFGEMAILGEGRRCATVTRPSRRGCCRCSGQSSDGSSRSSRTSRHGSKRRCASVHSSLMSCALQHRQARRDRGLGGVDELSLARHGRQEVLAIE